MVIIQCLQISIIRIIVITLFTHMISTRVNNEIYYVPIVFVCE